MRPKIDYRTTSRQAYSDFKQQYPRENISFQEFKQILTVFNTLFIEHILESGDRIKLPAGIGEISVAKFKPKRHKTFKDKQGNVVTITALPINWQKTRQLKTIIYHLNPHSDGNKYRWKWFKNTSRFATSDCFNFRANRIPSRKLAKNLKSDPRYAQVYRQWQD